LRKIESGDIFAIHYNQTFESPSRRRVTKVPNFSSQGRRYPKYGGPSRLLSAIKGQRHVYTAHGQLVQPHFCKTTTLFICLPTNCEQTGEGSIMAGLIDIDKPGTYPIILSDALLGKATKETYTGIRCI
jgi:hypothetical protein